METVTGMATIAKVGNIKIGMFPYTGKHHAPYFKAFIGIGSEKIASIRFSNDTVQVWENTGFKEKELKPVLEWAKKNLPALLNNWQKVLNKKNPNKITSSAPPLRTPRLKELKAFPGLILWSRWADGSERIFDFNKLDLVEAFAPLGDQSFFEKVKIVDGFPTWPDGLNLDYEDLWEISKPFHKAVSLTK